MIQERAKYVESEFEKWKEHYEVGFAEEYDVKLMLGLRHQLETTPDDRIKTKVDLINAINNLMRGLRLKPIQKEKYKIDIDSALVIDPCRDSTVYTEINFDDQRITHKKKIKGHFSSQAELICEKLSQGNIERICIDKSGIGMGLYDAILNKTLQYGIKIDNNGYVHKVN